LSLIGLADARALLLRDPPALGSERVALDALVGRTLAEAVAASHTQPAEPRATMDGIAVPDADPPAGAEWRLVGDAPAGAGAHAPIGAGEAIRVSTGAVVPEGAARVLPQELLESSDDRATLVSQPGSARFIRQAGADFKAGDRLLEPGVRIGPAELGLIAAANRASAEVAREPKVIICTAGDELVAPGSTLRDGQSVDSASHTLAALVRRWGGAPQLGPILPDDLEAITSAFRSAMETCDILLCIGGASVGRRDLMRPAAVAVGGKFLFEGIAVQPGKPCWHARSPAGLILGLPGNPSSAFVCAHLLLRPLIETLLTRAPADHLRQAYSAASLPANGEREQYLRASASYDAEGRLWAEKLADQDSGLQAVLAQAQLLIRRTPAAGPLEPGGSVEVVELTRV
jgi:molybdopterin molybdotransferase